jgi:glycogen debranching enzyme
MENPTAGAGAIEVGGLGEALWTDVYLAGVWTASLAGIREMAAARGDRRTEVDAARTLDLARATLEDRFWLDSAGIYAFALLQSEGVTGPQRLRTNDALTAWPATAMTFGLLDPARADRMLERLASPEITTDWGTRMLSREHPLYDPLHYNNGTVWPFVTGFVALAHYRYHRSEDGLHLIRAIAGTTFDFALGRNPELMSGAYYRPLDTAVPQQFFATSMLVSPVVRGLLGIDVNAPARRVTLAPHLPADWDRVAARNIHVGSDRLAMQVTRTQARTTVRIQRTTVGAPRRPPRPGEARPARPGRPGPAAALRAAEGAPPERRRAGPRAAAR